MGVVRAVLLDAAGTLLRPRDPVGETYATAARRMGVSISAWRLEDAFRRIHAKAPPMAFPDAPSAEIPALERGWWRAVVRGTFRAADAAPALSDFEGGFAWLWETYARADAWALLPDARAALEVLRADGFQTAIVSNFDHRLPGILAGLEIGRLLDVVMLPGEARAVKPDPAIFELALERLGRTASECIYVGDDADRDVAGARGIGLRAVGTDELATLGSLPARVAALSG